MLAKLLHLPALLLVVASAILLTACNDPETPQDVSKAFWQAVLDNDGGTAAELSTLVDESGFNRYGRDWAGASVTWGRVDLNGDRATIETVFTGLADLDGGEFETTTHLVQINDQWRVDYHRTGDSLSADASLDRLMGNVRALGDKLRSHLVDESDRAARELDRLAEELSAFTAQTERELATLIGQYGDSLARKLEELSRSLDQALEKESEANPADRKTLEEVRQAIEQQRDALQEPSADALARASKELARIQKQLSELSGDSYQALQNKLRQWSDELNRELERLNREARLQEHHSI